MCPDDSPTGLTVLKRTPHQRLPTAFPISENGQRHPSKDSNHPQLSLSHASHPAHQQIPSVVPSAVPTAHHVSLPATALPSPSAISPSNNQEPKGVCFLPGPQVLLHTADSMTPKTFRSPQGSSENTSKASYLTQNKI